MHIINTFDAKLETSGYSKAQRLEIIESGLVGYRRKVERQGGQRHRRGSDTKAERLKKKLSGKTSWYKRRGSGDKKRNDQGLRGTGRRQNGGKRHPKTQKGDSKTPAAVMFVPRTNGGELMKRIREK